MVMHLKEDRPILLQLIISLLCLLYSNLDGFITLVRKFEAGFKLKYRKLWLLSAHGY